MITDKLLKELKSSFDYCAIEILHKILYGNNKTNKTISIDFKEGVHLESMIGDFTTLKEVICYYDCKRPDYYAVSLYNDEKDTTWSLSLLNLPENTISEIIHATSDFLNSK